MLRSLKEVKGYVLRAKDGDIGRCKDFLIDDSTWTVRYMVADTSRWLLGRRVLVSPIALDEPEWLEKRFPIHLTKDEVQNAPELDEKAPVTRQYEIWYHQHYGWPYYWSGGGLWASAIDPRTLSDAKSDLGEEGPDFDRPHLHSADEILGYNIRATDGEIGHVDDFILDDETWAVRYAVAATRNWLPGKHVLIPMARLKQVVWSDSVLEVELTRENVKDSPEYHPGLPVNVEFEERIYDFVGRPKDRR
jgi:hypothetical protein